MLVLSRHAGEAIVIVLPDGRTVEITPLDIGGNKTRLGIKADRDIPVHRIEVYEKIRQPNDASVGGDDSRKTPPHPRSGVVARVPGLAQSAVAARVA